MLDTRISSANARELAARSHEARRKRKEAETLAAATQPAIPHANPTIAEPDAYSQCLMHAQNEILAQLRKAPLAKDKAALAQALKNLRETYHLATGLAKPGVRKPERQSTRQQSSAPSGPELPPDTTTGGGSTGQ